MTQNPRRLVFVPGSSSQTLDDFADFVDTEILGLLIDDDDQDTNMGDEAFINIDSIAYT